MDLSFRQACSLTIGALLPIGLVWLFFPQWFFYLLQLDSNPAAVFVAHRGAMFYFGVSLLAFLIRNTQPSDIRDNIATTLAVIYWLLAGLGVYEFFTGHCGAAIFLAVLGEIGLGGIFLQTRGPKY